MHHRSHDQHPGGGGLPMGGGGLPTGQVYLKGWGWADPPTRTIILGPQNLGSVGPGPGHPWIHVDPVLSS